MITRVSFTFASSSVFCRRCLCRAISRTSCLWVRVRSRRRRVHGVRRASVTRTLGRLGKVLGVSYGAAGAGLDNQPPLQAAVGLVAKAYPVSVDTQARPEDHSVPAGAADTATIAEGLARRAGVRTRRIVLEPRLVEVPGSVLRRLARADERPLGLLSNRRGGYRAVDPETGAEFAVNRTRAAGIAPEALAFYPPLPDNLENAGQTLRFALHGRGQDLRTVLTVSTLGGLAALVVPILTRPCARRVHSAGQRAVLGRGARRLDVACVRQCRLLRRAGTGAAAHQGPPQ